MKVVFGGAFNGKLEWVLNETSLSREEIYYCNSCNLEFDKKVICGLHVFVYECVIKGIDPVKILAHNTYKLQDKIIICDDLSSGIVPLKKEDREWREATGRCIQYLNKQASKVYRIFFGLQQVIKDE